MNGAFFCLPEVGFFLARENKTAMSIIGNQVKRS
jgi:hypothetical protein